MYRAIRTISIIILAESQREGINDEYRTALLAAYDALEKDRPYC